MKFKGFLTLFLILQFSAPSFGAGFGFFSLFKNKNSNLTRTGTSSKGNSLDSRFSSRDPNCPDRYPTWFRNTNRAARDTRAIQNHLAANSATAESSALVNRAMAQVTCPTQNIGAGRGECSPNGYRSSSYDCAFYVRNALRGTIIPPGGGLGNAKDVGCNLQRYGMTNLCRNGCSAQSMTCTLSPYNVPVGAVLVYDNTGRSCHWAGHVEIRTPQGFVSDYFSTRPRNENSSCRRLIGVWVK